MRKNIGLILIICIAISAVVFPSFAKFLSGAGRFLVVPAALIAFFGFLLWFYVYLPYSEGGPDRILIRKEKEEALEYQRQLAKKRLKEIKTTEHSLFLEVEENIRKLPKYKTWRRHVFDKWGSLCEHCGSGREANLEIHHRRSLYSIVKQHRITDTYKAIECDELWDVDNGTILCEFCHEHMESSKQRKKLLSL